MWQARFDEALKEAEYVYDRVVKRWGNTHFARSTLYDWIWSEHFETYCAALSPREQGALRIAVMEHFRVKPWPWHTPKQAENRHRNKGQQHRGIL